MQFRILGPLRVDDLNGHPIQLEPRLIRLLAAFLVANDGVVARSRLIDAVWDDNPPRTVDQQLKNLISSLRRRLAVTHETELIHFESTGYRMSIPRERIDANAFLDRCAHARALSRQGQTAEAVRQLREALALWRAPALDGCGSRSLEAAAAGLNEQRMTALELRIQLELELGRHQELIGELTEQATAHPTHEGLAGQLMLALFRSGRQTDALSTYRRLRSRLAAEQGCEPSQQVSDIHQAILRGEPTLLALTRQGSPQATSEESSIAPERAADHDTASDGSTDAPHPPRERTPPALDATPTFTSAATGSPRGSVVKRTHRTRLVYLSVLTTAVLSLAGTVFALSGAARSDGSSGDAGFISANTPSDPPTTVSPPPIAVPTPTTQPSRPPSSKPVNVDPDIDLLRKAEALNGRMEFVLKRPIEELTPIPEDYKSAGTFAGWASSNGGVDARDTIVKLTFQAVDDLTIVLKSVDVNVKNRAPLSEAYIVYVRRILAAPNVQVREAVADLDDPIPRVKMADGSDFDYVISKDEPATALRLRVHTTTCYCSWTLTLHYSVNGTPGSIEIDNNGKPFRTAGTDNLPSYVVDDERNLRG